MSFIQWYRKVRNIHRRGTRADQPLATDVLEGTIYFVTDETVLERSNGVAWESYGGGGGIVGFTSQFFSIDVDTSAGGTTSNTASINPVDVDKSFISGVTQRAVSFTDNPARDFTVTFTTNLVTATFNTTNIGIRRVTGWVVTSN